MSILDTKIQKPNRKQALKFIIEVLKTREVSSLRTWDVIRNEINKTQDEIQNLLTAKITAVCANKIKLTQEFAALNGFEFHGRAETLRSRYDTLDTDLDTPACVYANLSYRTTIDISKDEDLKELSQQLSKLQKEQDAYRNRDNKKDSIEEIAELLPEKAIEHIEAIANMLKEAAESMKKDNKE